MVQTNQAGRQRKTIYELQDLQIAMIGTRDRPTMVSIKAAESGTFVAFAAHMAKTHRDRLTNQAALVAAGDALMKYMEITRGSPLRFTNSARQEFADAMVRYLAVREAAGIPFKPKIHLAAHMILDSAYFGNPCRTGTWLDEGLNAQLAAVCRVAHAHVWSRRVLACFGHAAGPAAKVAASASKKPKLRS